VADNRRLLSHNAAQKEISAMTENAVVRARIDETIKSEAAAVLATMWLSLSDAFRLLLRRVALEKALTFEPLVPNAETVEAMKAARRGDVITVGKPSRLLASLDADC
jgi:DNA-damage-inducible protein J